MEELRQILLLHAKKYPRMEPRDAVKLLYQGEFGGGHLIRDEKSCLAMLSRELANTPSDPNCSLYEDIGNGLVRVCLAALPGSSLDEAQLGRAFLQSAAEHRGSLDRFLAKLELLRQVTAAGVFGFSPAQLEEYLEDYAREGYPMVSHTETYRAAYRPAYRVVLKKHLPLSE